MANIKSIGGNPIVLGLDGLTDDAKQALGSPVVAGGAEALLGADATDTWLQRTSTGSGAATVSSVQGASEVIDGELVPVQISGIAATGFNQWDEVWEHGYINDSNGANNGSSASYLRSKNYVPAMPSTTYYLGSPSRTANGKIYYYDADKSYITYASVGTGYTATTPADCRYVRFWLNYSGDYAYDLCLNVSDPALNGTYRPYQHDELDIPAGTYFPTGMWAAGARADELTATHAVVRIAEVDLGTLEWTHVNSSSPLWYAPIDGAYLSPSSGATELTSACSGYTAVTNSNSTEMLNSHGDKSVCVQRGFSRVFLRDDSKTGYTVEQFTAAVDGIGFAYWLATPVITEINPPLNMTYRIEQGGTEFIVVPDGEISAAPIITVAEGKSAQAVVMDALAAIAAPDGPTATANHAVGTYLTMSGKLYKVTRAIASGEQIVSGTNVTEITVMAELLALAN